MADTRLKTSLIRSRLKEAYSLLSPCRACPRRCGVNRFKGETGICGAGFLPEISSDNLHFGEEPPISGTRGSGTVFFAGCSLRCAFCQNYPISQMRHGKRTTVPGLAGMMVRLQERGAHNINLVTPSHFAPQIMGALLIAYESGLNLPLVYNCGGYESLEMLKLWDGIMDVYMPDMKYADPAHAGAYSSAADYPEINRAAVAEMARQAGVLRMDGEGIALRGLLIRHLVLPGGLAGTETVLRFIAERISPETHVSLMSQYFPAHLAPGMPPIDRKVTPSEYAAARSLLERFGLEHGWVQE
jgi:putative pyruvate formate lyase activating enzyme